MLFYYHAKRVNSITPSPSTSRHKDKTICAYSSSILSISALASSHVSLFFFAHSIWLLAYASCHVAQIVSTNHLYNDSNGNHIPGLRLTIYLFRSSSFWC